MQHTIEMEGANSAMNWTVECVEFLTMQVGNVPFKVHAHVIENANFSLLFDHPFQQVLLCHFEDLPEGEVEVSICDPTKIACRVYVPTCSHSRCTPTVKTLSVVNHTPNSAITLHMPPSLLLPDPATLIYKYKKVDQKVRPVPSTLPKDFCNIHCIPVDPLLSLLALPTHHLTSRLVNASCRNDLTNFISKKKLVLFLLIPFLPPK